MSELMKFHCVLSNNEINTPKIERIMINFFGTPASGNKKIQNYKVISFDEKESFKGFTIKCTETEINQMKEQLIKEGIYDFDKCFTHDREHFHPYCTVDEADHEGVAYKNKSEWEVKYTEGPLWEQLGEPGEEHEHFIFSVEFSEIADEKPYDFINRKFKEWVRNYTNYT